MLVVKFSSRGKGAISSGTSGFSRFIVSLLSNLACFLAKNE